MKTIYIAHDDKKEVVQKLISLIQKNDKELKLLGYGGQNVNSLKEISMSKPDYAIVGQLPFEGCIDLLKLSPLTKIVMIANDENRAISVLNELEKVNKNGNLVFNFDVEPETVIQTIMESEEPFPGESGNGMDNFLSTGLEEKKTVSKEDVTQAKEEKTEVDEKINESVKISEDIEELKEKKNKIDLLNLKSKFITIISKKGGTGKTTLAKEMAFVYGNINLPKRLNYTNKFLKVCLVDLDFEDGNLRTMLGIENPSPNIYTWIEDIVNRLDNGMKIEQIKYDKMQVLTRFIKPVDKGLFVLCTNQGGVPSRLVDKILELDNTPNQTLFKGIISLILRSVKNAFDIVICDTSSTFDETSIDALELSDDIVYCLCPTISDLDGLKTSVQELSSFDNVNMSNLIVVVNKMVKDTGLDDSFESMLGTIYYRGYSYETGKVVKVPLKVNRVIPFDSNVMKAENHFAFACERQSHFKNIIVSMNQALLPIFKIKSKGSMKMMTEMQKKDKEIELLKENKKKAQWLENKKKMEDKKKRVDDFKKIKTLENFEKYLLAMPETKKTNNGYPVVQEKPKGTKLVVWLKYNKKLDNELKKELKSKEKVVKE